ncbi:hypothetical protein, partial [Streptomyces sp. wa1063]|uniref:hypothetical protein n=1 Tax=Streptomyces sp. wa1063 TaxID=1828212 RepID=UPI00211DA230
MPGVQVVGGDGTEGEGGRRRLPGVGEQRLQYGDERSGRRAEAPRGRRGADQRPACLLYTSLSG